MRHAALILLAIVVTGCAGTGVSASRGGPPPTPVESALVRLDARMVGLEDELDRLSRRVRALEEGPVGAEPKPVEGALPPEEPLPPTGLLVDLRPLGDAFPAGRSYSSWQIVDREGEGLPSSDALLPERPTFFTAREGEELTADLESLIGARPLAVAVVSAEVRESGSGRLARVVVDDGSAEVLRKSPRLDRVAFLVRP